MAVQTTNVHFTTGYPISDFIIKPVVAPPTIVIPPQNVSSGHARHPLQHPCAYNRVKETLKQMLRAMLDYCKMNPHATDTFAQIVRENGAAATVDELRHQLDAYWCQEHPFNKVVKDGNTLAWWEALAHHPSAQVLAVCTTSSLLVTILSASSFARLWPSKFFQLW